MLLAGDEPVQYRKVVVIGEGNNATGVDGGGEGAVRE